MGEETQKMAPHAQTPAPLLPHHAQGAGPFRPFCQAATPHLPWRADRADAAGRVQCGKSAIFLATRQV